jgi:methionyl-tRNA synthetase
VEGICPVCAYPKARGDQCDNCGSLLDPKDLKEPYSRCPGVPEPEVRETRHLYQLHSRWQDRIRAWVEAQPGWPHLTRSIAIST